MERTNIRKGRSTGVRNHVLLEKDILTRDRKPILGKFYGAIPSNRQTLTGKLSKA